MNDISMGTWPGKMLSRDLVRDLTRNMTNLVLKDEGRLAEADVIREQLVRCDALGRRGEVEQFVKNFDAEMTEETRREFAISMHPAQVNSKLWLTEELERHCDFSAMSLVILGAWYGTLPLIINWRISTPSPQMICIDSDGAAGEVGARMIGSLYSNIEYRCADAMELDYNALDTRDPPVVINTICEHLADPPAWWARIPGGQLVAVQSNNYTACPDHISCVFSIEQFKQQCPMCELLFEGVLHFPEGDRFMLIGRR